LSRSRASVDVDVADFGARMPALDGTAYLNTGASSPDSVAVVESMTEFLMYHGYEAPTEEGTYPPVDEAYDRTRTDVADLLGATPDEIALTQSTGDGMSRVANAIRWTAGDTIVRTDLAHEAGVVPWRAIAEDHDVGVEVVETTDGRIDVDDLKEAVTDARLVCLDSIARSYGTDLPVAEIVAVAHDAGAEVLVDAVQSVGQTPVDVDDWGADYVAAASHKWLVGPWGAGFLYVDTDVVSDLAPRHASYRSVDREAADLPFHPDARRLEVGTAAAAPYVGLRTALERLAAVGVDAVEDRIRSLTGLLRTELPDDALVSPRGFESGLVVVDDDDPARTAARLADRDVYVRSIADPEAIRVSVHAYNDEADVRAFCEAFEAVR
jgi:selenocysteine lyase/cysteine desulfurase